MEEVDMQKKEPEKEENKEPEKEEVQKELPKGFYLTEVAESYRRLIAFGKKEVSPDVLIVKMANHLMQQTGFKLEE